MTRFLIIGAAWLWVCGCSSPEPLPPTAGKPADVHRSGDSGAPDGAGEVGDVTGADAAAGYADAPLWEEVEVAAADPDQVGDAGAADGLAAADPGAGGDTAVDGASDAQGDGPTDAAGMGTACGVCPWNAAPAPPHPGAKGPFAPTTGETFSYGAGLGAGYKSVLVVRPDAAGMFPTVLFAPGKLLYEGGGFSPKLGHPYRAFLDHLASHGYVVAFVRVEMSALDADHLRMADDLLAASLAVFGKVSQADPTKVAYVGHSMGAKVALLAAWRTLNNDPKGEWADPRAVFAFSVSNEPPPFGAFQNAVDKAKVMWKDAPTVFTFATGADDATAAWNTAGKPNAKALYDALPTTFKQLIVVHGTGPGDPNPPTKPELADDHAAPLSIEGKPGGAADLAIENSHLDALDWYGFWKWTAGGLNYHFNKGDPAWAYGALRSHGGDLGGGGLIAHEVAAQGFSSPPPP